MPRPVIAFFLYCLFCLSLPVSALETPEAREPDLRGVSREGLTIEIFSEMSPLGLNRLHAWRIHLRDARGEPVTGASLRVGGGMPDHDHGLPTLPLVSGEAAPGIYLLQGMRLHMPGRWVISVDIESGHGADEATLEFHL